MGGLGLEPLGEDTPIYTVSADLPLRYLLGKLWPVPPQPRKSPHIPPKPRLSHPGSSDLSCCCVTLGDKWGFFQVNHLPACLPARGLHHCQFQTRPLLPPLLL